jgi:hypothetical protein
MKAINALAIHRCSLEFNITDLPRSTLIDRDPKEITGRAAGLASKGQTVTLRVDSAPPLSNGVNIIPFSNIFWQGRGDFPAGGFNDPTNQKVGQWSGSGHEPEGKVLSPVELRWPSDFYCLHSIAACHQNSLTGWHKINLICNSNLPIYLTITGF